MGFTTDFTSSNFYFVCIKYLFHFERYIKISSNNPFLSNIITNISRGSVILRKIPNLYHERPILLTSWQDCVNQQ